MVLLALPWTKMYHRLWPNSLEPRWCLMAPYLITAVFKKIILGVFLFMLLGDGMQILRRLRVDHEALPTVCFWQRGVSSPCPLQHRLSMWRPAKWAHRLTDEATILWFGHEHCSEPLRMALTAQKAGFICHAWYTPRNKRVDLFWTPTPKTRVGRTTFGFLNNGGTV